MILSWIFAGHNKRVDRELANRLIVSWEIDQAKITAFLIKLDEARDAREKAFFAVVIFWHIDNCYKNIFATFHQMTASVPPDKMITLASAKAMKQIGDEATKIHAQMEPHFAILEGWEVNQIIDDLKRNKSG